MCSVMVCVVPSVLRFFCSTVRDHPVLAALPEVSVVQLAPVVLGTSVTLMCSASGDSPISYTWEQVGQEGVVLSTDESFTLVVVEVSQYGMYRCTATNILGRDSSTVDVIQASKSLVRNN